jgi:hypothetical protein
MAAAIGGGTLVTVNHVGTGGGGVITPPPGTANLWIDSNGGTCTRQPVASGYVDAAACSDGPAAYAKAQLGDTILMASMNVTTVWNFDKTKAKNGSDGTCNYNNGVSSNLTQCITIAPAPGATVTFTVPGTLITQIVVCVDHLLMKDITINLTTYVESVTSHVIGNQALIVGNGGNACGTTQAPHDDMFQDINYGGGAGAVGGAYNVWYVGGVAVETADTDWQMGGTGNNTVIPYAHNNGVVGMEFDGYNFVNHSYGSPKPHHMECIHSTLGSDQIEIRGNKFIACPVESYFAQGSGQTNIMIENNMFFGGNLGNGPLKFDCTTNTGCTLSGITVRFNSFASGTFLLLENACGGTAPTCNISGNKVYGNIAPSCPSSTLGVSGPAGAWVMSYNIQTSSQSGICAGDSTSLYSQSPNFVDPLTPNYDLRMAGSGSWCAFVPSGVSGGIPVTDFDGATRVATGGAYEAGASATGCP